MIRKLMLCLILTAALSPVLMATEPNSSVSAAKEVVILKSDLSKGKAPQAIKVEGGKFVPQGWTPVNGTDNILWRIPNGNAVTEGYVEIVMTNLNPTKQATVPKNQFIGLDETCDEKGVKVRLRMGKNYQQFKIEAHDGVKSGLGSWEEPRVNPLKGPFDEKATYVFRISWNPKGFAVHLNDIEMKSFPWPPKGFCTVQIGETYATLKGAFPGPIYKSIKFVSLSGKPQDAKPAKAALKK
jgi:hypothetical protein